MLDFGCGASHLLEYMLEQGITRVKYSGLDLSPKFLALSRSKHPSVTYYELDVLEDSQRLPDFDYIILNGIFNYRGELSHEEMLAYWPGAAPRRLSQGQARDRLQRDVHAGRLAARRPLPPAI